jgi:MFS transporter, OPA family, glycerol-3-phosphate transporter
MPSWLRELGPVLALLVLIVLLVARLPRVEVGHSAAFRTRRSLNWLLVGMTYAFLYMGRYNLNVCKTALGAAMSKADFGTIFSWGTLTYGFAFIINGPLTDRIGGQRTIVISALGSAAANLALGLLLATGRRTELVPIVTVLYCINMYFQSFGAVSIVKVNASWFHLRERGTFGGIFGILISLGIYFAYDWGRFIVEHAPVQWVFFVPAILLSVFAVLDVLFVRDTPGRAGLADFNTADASSGDDGPPLGVVAVAARMLQSPVILTIAAVEFCSGYLRNGVMQWYPIFASETGATFVSQHWGVLLCAAGILGGMFAGVISDHVFSSRRGPVSAVLYGVLVVGTAAMFLLLESPALGWLMVVLSLSVIGVHGMLSGTASMDFGGTKNVGVAVGLIDGFVYLGTAAEAAILGRVLPHGAAAKVTANWWTWSVVMVPIAVAGFVLATRVWNARPQPRSYSH